MAKQQPSLKDLKNALSQVEAKWRQLGVQFGFTEDQLDALQANDPHGGVNQWLSSMLNAKLNNCPDFSWSHVISALEKLGLTTLAMNIRQRFCQSMIVRSVSQNMALDQMTEYRLKNEFADLLEEACTYIESNVKPDVFRTYLRTIFTPALQILGNTVREMFTVHSHWNYLHYRSLLLMIRNFDKDGKMHGKCHKYHQSVAKFTFTTRVTDWITQRNLETAQGPQPPLQPTEYSKLTVKVNINITDAMLGYVIGLWTEIAEQLFRLPDLDAVLHDMKEQCLLITWLIPRSDNLQSRIKHNAPNSTSFFEQRKIQYCVLNNEQIYKSQEGKDDIKPQVRQSSLPLTNGQRTEETPLLPDPRPRRSRRQRRRLTKSGMAAGSINYSDQEERSKCCCCCVIL